MRLMRAIALTVLCAALCTTVLGQNHQSAAHHRAQTRTAGPYLLEMLADGDAVSIRVRDRAGTPVDTAGGKGKAVIHTDGRAVTIELHPVTPNVLSGRGHYRLKRSTVVYVTIDLKKARAQRTVFRPLSESPPQP